MSEALATMERAHHWAPYTNRDELVAEVCERLAAGETLLGVSRDAHMPGWSTLYEWLTADDEVAGYLSRAREAGFDAMAEHALAIADDRSGDPQRDKLRIDTRFKLLGKWHPKKYGDSTQLRHADADGGKLDTAPLVGELLGLMQPGAAITSETQSATARAVQAPAPVTYRDVTSAPVQAPARRPRMAWTPKADSVDDLV